MACVSPAWGRASRNAIHSAPFRPDADARPWALNSPLRSLAGGAIACGMSFHSKSPNPSATLVKVYRAEAGDCGFGWVSLASPPAQRDGAITWTKTVEKRPASPRLVALHAAGVPGARPTGGAPATPRLGLSSAWEPRAEVPRSLFPRRCPGRLSPLEALCPSH